MVGINNDKATFVHKNDRMQGRACKIADKDIITLSGFEQYGVAWFYLIEWACVSIHHICGGVN